MAFDTICRPSIAEEQRSEKLTLQQFVGLYYHSIKQTYRNRKRLTFGALSFIVLFSSSLMFLRPYTIASAAEKTNNESTNSTNSPGKPNILGIDLKNLMPALVPSKRNKIVLQSGERGVFGEVYVQAGKKYGVPWEILAAIHFVETGQSGDTEATSSAGALGPMQFMQGTFDRYQVDGDNDGVISIYDVHDAIYTAARQLAANGASSGDVRRALYNYNHSNEYVERVLNYAMGLGYSI